MFLALAGTVAADQPDGDPGGRANRRALGGVAGFLLAGVGIKR